MAVLPSHQPILLEVLHTFKGSLRLRLKKNPADMCMEKTLRDVVGIIIVIDELMMASMVRRPAQDRILKGRRAKQQREEAHWPLGFKSQVRE